MTVVTWSNWTLRRKRVDEKTRKRNGSKNLSYPEKPVSLFKTPLHIILTTFRNYGRCLYLKLGLFIILNIINRLLDGMSHLPNNLLIKRAHMDLAKNWVNGKRVLNLPTNLPLSFTELSNPIIFILFIVPLGSHTGDQKYTLLHSRLLLTESWHSSFWASFLYRIKFWVNRLIHALRACSVHLIAYRANK